ncbi:MAG: hypothetical protein KJ558_00700 [Gammaproteobacteria bacterium]|nr:hypothetical protein [Gammaproteobacteria bacterium]MBU1653355.1 hypothetical protein [Gammaproteobacteria bacterium]MBU1962782.1 hypothetical protein [Gammaproteobacteria bacterium]
MPTQIAHMDTAFFDDRVAYEREECEIRINDSEIVVSYDDGAQVIYIRRFNRSNCTTSTAVGKRHHVLYPAQTYFLGSEP